jgi:hypothetical protein
MHPNVSMLCIMVMFRTRQVLSSGAEGRRWNIVCYFIRIKF